MANEIRGARHSGDLGSGSSGESPGPSLKTGEDFLQNLLRELKNPGSSHESVSLAVGRRILDPLETFEDELNYSPEDEAVIRRFADDAQRLVKDILSQEAAKNPLLSLDIGLSSLENKYSKTDTDSAVTTIRAGRKNIRELQDKLKKLYDEEKNRMGDTATDEEIVDRICETRGKHSYRKDQWYFRTELVNATLDDSRSHGNLFREVLQLLGVIQLDDTLSQAGRLAKTKHAGEGSEVIIHLLSDLFLDHERSTPLAVANITGLSFGGPVTSGIELEFSKKIVEQIIKGDSFT